MENLPPVQKSSIHKTVNLQSAIAALAALHFSMLLNAVEPVQFNRDIRPILSDNCWACHGPDARVRKAKLRLDLRESAIKKVIVPGDAKSSPLVQKIFSGDAEEVMPPREHRKKLSPEQKETLRRWIQEGAKWQDHWAWTPPTRPTAPKEGAIDFFIQRKLKKAGFQPSPVAEPHTLVRRLSFDLLGLPPKPETVDTFSKARDANAYNRLVDQFLSSPAFGERMAVNWLDLVRYADTNGYHADIEWSVSPYREYVINAFNTNMPFDRFTREQIAGDLIPEATLQQKIAAGYNRLNMKSTEFGIQDKEYLAKYASDRVRTTATTWLGVTLGCAECHDHKFDPFTTQDFYSFAAFFADIKGLGYYPNAQKVGWGERITIPDKNSAARIKILEKELSSLSANVILADATEKAQKWSYTFKNPGQGWEKPDFDDKAWAEGDGGFGSSNTPNTTVRTEWKSSDIWMRKKFMVPAIPGSLVLNIQHDEDARVHLNGKQVAHLKGYSTGSAEYVTRVLDVKALRTGKNLIAIHCHQTSGGQFIDAGLQTKADRRNEFKKEIAKLKSGRGNRTMLATVSIKPRTMRVLPRGNWMDDSGKIVTPATPGFLGNGTTGTRRQLAEWITSPQNPLTARVFVNRLWKIFFGSGLARVMDDIGSQGDWPSHPELLDWLAVEFVESGWNVKHVVRLIVNSQAYRQSSRPNKPLLAKDPQNHLLARQARFRLDAEFVRDNALAVSGLLVNETGGSSVKPYQPKGYWANLNFPRRTYRHDTGSSQYRRGVYVHWQRQFLHPALLAFDAPAREECTAERARSNTPLAALALLNDPSQVEAARVLAEKSIQQKGDDSQRIQWMFRQVLSREPTPRETRVLQELLKAHRRDFATDTSASTALLKVGLHPATDKVPAAELAAWTSVARAMLNLHETITRF